MESRLLSVKWNEDTIGFLLKEENRGYLFKYSQEGMRKARAEGFYYLVGFKDVRKTYISKELFPAFKSRVPSKQRRDITNKLSNIGLQEYDEFSYLARTGGRLLTDGISFEEVPIRKRRIAKAKNMSRIKPRNLITDERSR